METIATEIATESNPTIPEPPGYVNPLESSSRWYLTARAQAIRYAASLGFSIANRMDPPAPAPTKEIWLDSTLSEQKAKEVIKVEIWDPARLSPTPRAAIITMHGGGWILGQGTDDARWVGAVMNSLDAVVFTVNYRLAPSYPFPIPIEDCVDAILQIIARAEEFNIDPTKIVLSGFSAGASNALASWVILNDPSTWNYKLPPDLPEIAGLSLFYPVLDWTISRPEKRQTCSRPDLTLPKGLTDLIDASYVFPPIPREQRTDARLSPGLMSDTLLRRLPPIHLCLCEYDMLLAEGIRFTNRLESEDMPFTSRIVKGERHGWDNPPPMAPKESVIIEYSEAIQAIASWLGPGVETDQESLAGSINSVKTKRPRLRRPRYLTFRSRTTR